MINFLKAQHFVYASAKKWIAPLFFCMILWPLVINIVTNFVKNDVFLGLLIVATFIFTGLGYVIRYIYKKKKLLAAGIQQKFDLYVLDIKETCGKYLKQKMPQRECVIKAVKKYESKEDNLFLNWYSDYSKLPFEQAVFFCQKENLNWTLKLKKVYLIFLICFFTVIFIGIVINSILSSDLLIKFVLILFTLFPLILSFAEGLRKIIKDISCQQEIQEKIKQIETELNKLNGKALNDLSEKLQAEIYMYRQKSYMVPEWFYKITRKKYQNTEDEIAREISEEYKPKGKRKGKNESNTEK